DLSVNGVYATYQWFSGTSPINGATSSSYTVSQSGVYSVYVTNQGCEGTSNTIQVNSTFVPPPPIPNDFGICQGEEIGISISDIYDSYQWFDGGVPIAGATSATYTFTVNNTVGISVEVTLNNCSVSSGEFLITSLPIPQITITPSTDIQVCQDS